uniref:Uncharacterized protein n=1 Tax=Arundo donax TaxID=35708 RepID=A0A0A8XQF4_ARUDO
MPDPLALPCGSAAWRRWPRARAWARLLPQLRWSASSPFSCGCVLKPSPPRAFAAATGGSPTTASLLLAVGGLRRAPSEVFPPPSPAIGCSARRA